MVGIELLPHRIAHGHGTVLCVYRVGGNHRPAGDFLGGISEAAVDPDIFCLLSHDTAVWRESRRGIHGPLHRATGEVALEPPRPARAERELDHGRQYPAAHGGT